MNGFSGSVIVHRSLSIQEWRRMAAEGAAPPVRIQLNGVSMFPLVRWKRDYVTIVQPTGIPTAGDIVLYSDYLNGKERYVVHRVWEVRGGKILTWGDNCAAPDGWCAAKDILGKVVLIERGNRKIIPDPRKGIRWGKFWHQAGKAYRVLESYKAAAGRRIRKLFERGNR